MNENMLCPICESGTLEEKVEYNNVDYKGNTIIVPLYFDVCDSCGSEQANSVILRKNKMALITAKIQADGRS